MNRFYIIVTLLFLLGVAAGGIVFFSPDYRVAYYAGQIERDLKEHPAGPLIQVTFPDKVDQDALARAVAEVWLDNGYAAAIYRMELTLLHSASPLVAASLPNAARDAVDRYMRLTYEAFERLADTDPDSCGVIAGHPQPDGVQDTNMALISVMSADEKRAYYTALTDIIVSANRRPSPIALTLNQTYDFIRAATADAVERMGKARAAQSLTAAPQEPYDACLLQSYILQNLLNIDDAFRPDVFKVQMLRGAVRRKMQSLPPATPGGVPPGNKAPAIDP